MDACVYFRIGATTESACMQCQAGTYFADTGLRAYRFNEKRRRANSSPKLILQYRAVPSTLFSISFATVFNILLYSYGPVTPQAHRRVHSALLDLTMAQRVMRTMLNFSQCSLLGGLSLDSVYSYIFRAYFRKVLYKVRSAQACA